VQVRINTSSAGFTRPPLYFASLQGRLFVPDDGTGKKSIAFHLHHIDEVTIKGFVFRFIIVLLQLTPDGTARPVGEVRKFLERRQAYIEWLAIEWDSCNS
jgi:hypothetical protein